MVFAGTLSAQKTLLFTDEDYTYKLGVELFEKEHYAQAMELFDKVIAYYGNEPTDIKADAEYYRALCSIELFNNDAEYLIARFIANYPESPRTRVAYFEMAIYKYRKGNYQEALFYFDKVWKQNLTKEQLYEFYFKRGYSYFKTDNLTASAKMFYELLNKDSKFTAPAQYFYAHVAYLDKNYETALNGFTKLNDDPTFAPLVPYYLVQIYYLQGKNDKVLELGTELLTQTDTKREAEIARLVGEAFYARKEFEQALEYLEVYKNKADTYTRDDMYQLGYAYYMTQNYEQAMATLSNITNVEDGLTQNAFFHMADCNLKLDSKEQARMAFEAASKLDFNKEVKEISLLNYAKLSYELSYSPFNETITAFYDYITTYPKSIHHDEAYSYLVKVYLSSRNYKDALASLNKIKVKSPEMMAAHQRVAFFRGLELFNNLQFSGALAAFELSLGERAFDKKMHSLAIYWKAEALYRLERYQEAAESYNQFLLTPGAYLLDEYHQTYYNMGYCYFKLKNYKQAISWFRKYTDNAAKTQVLKRGDAFIRIADSYFVTRQYIDAVEYYDMAVKLDTFDVDYALFQKGFSFGLLKQFNAKINTLSTLLTRQPASTYAADALFERGRSYVALDSANKAIADFNLLVQSYPNSSYVVKSLLQLGLLYYGADKPDLALESYKRVVSQFQGTAEANDALLGIKNIYVDLNRVNEYVTFAEAYGGAGNISVTEKDSLTYLAAEKIYMSGKWGTAKNLFTDYLANYANGRFVLNARYYRADCFNREQKDDSALIDFQFVIDRAKNIFTEPSLLNAAQLYEQKKADSVAYRLYNKLENQAEVKSSLLVARKGQMHTAFKMQDYTNAIEASRRVIMTDKVSEEEVRDARLIMGKSFKAQNLMDPAITEFRILALDVKSQEGAEGKYRVAEILYQQNRLDEAEKTIMEYISMGTPHQYWLAKAFILLSDIYIKKDDGFMAKANLQSVIDNYKTNNDGIIEEAREKLSVIVNKENKQFIEKDKTNNGLNDTY
jgi:tetratricopeptide (TPR) repeat protein